MNVAESLAHSKWVCKYHIVFIPKYRRKALFGELRRHLGEVFKDLARQKECTIEEGHLRPDHVHLLISIPPKHSVSQVVGYLKGKSAIHIARVFMGRKKNFVGQHFWARGYYVTTIGHDAEVVREYIKRQEEEDKRSDQMKFW
jgi:putative transposase